LLGDVNKLKGQLISKGPFAIFTWTKKRTKNFSISALGFVGSSLTQGSILFFLKSGLKWTFFQLFLHLFLFIWIKYIIRHFKKQIIEKIICPWVGLEPTKVLYISRAEIENFFVRFLVQAKIVRSLFEINWPLTKINFQKTCSLQTLETCST
jgi:hypothetical protein